MPLCTTDTLSEECGWAFIELGIPWVAHLTWPIPIVPFKLLLDKFFYNTSTLPSHLTSFKWPSFIVAIPAES